MITSYILCGAAALGLPPLEDSIAAQFPDPLIADAEQVYQAFEMVRCAAASPAVSHSCRLPHTAAQQLWINVHCGKI